MQVPFGELLPVLPDHLNPGATAAKNVYPAANSYRPWKAVTTATANALSARCQGASSFTSDGGNVSIFAGDVSKLYRILANSVVDESGGTTFSVDSNGYWDFVKFGETIIAFNGANAPQAWTLDSSSDFAALSGSPPSFRHAAVVNNFIVTGFQPTARNKVQWSAVNDATGWTAGTNQSDSETLPEGGVVTGVTGGQYGLIFQENRITRMDYRGGNVIFSFRRIEDNIGAVQGKSVIKVGNLVYFLSEDGFRVTDGNTSKPIGNGKVDRFFNGDLRFAHREKVKAAVDYKNKLVCWSYPSVDSGTTDKLIVYNYENQRWSIVEIDHEMIFNYISPGYSVDDLDDYPSTGSNNLDAINVPLDSDIFVGGLRSFGVFDNTHKFGTFEGTALAAEVGTAETEIFPQNRSLLTHVRPIVDTSSATGSLTYRNRVADSQTTTSPVTAMHATGTIPFHKSARYFKFNMQIAAGTSWSDAQGVDVEAIKEGYR